MEIFVHNSWAIPTMENVGGTQEVPDEEGTDIQQQERTTHVEGNHAVHQNESAEQDMRLESEDTMATNPSMEVGLDFMREEMEEGGVLHNTGQIEMTFHVQSLTGILQAIDLDHPDAPKIVNLLLKALESLSRAANASEQFLKSEGLNRKKTTGSIGRHDEQTAASAAETVEHNQNDWGPTTFCSAFRGFIHHG